MSELEKLLDVSKYIADAVCGIYFGFGFFTCMLIESLVELVYSKWKKHKKEEKEGDNL